MTGFINRNLTSIGVPMARYAYMRVSTGVQDHHAQRHVLKKYFKKYDEWYEDTGTGRKTQPDLKLLLARVKKGDEIVISAFDRLGRNTKEVIAIVDKLKKKGVFLTSIKEKVDLTSAAGNMIFQTMCMVAEFESSHISERIKCGLEAAKERGVTLGARKIIETKEGKKAISYSRKLREKGYTLREIKQKVKDAKDFNISLGSLIKYL